MKSNLSNENRKGVVEAIGGIGSRPYYNNGKLTHMVTFTLRYGDVVEYAKKTRDGVVVGDFEKPFFDCEVEIDSFIEINDDGFDVEYYVGGKKCYNKFHFMSCHFKGIENMYLRCKDGFYYIFNEMDYPCIFIYQICNCDLCGVNTSCPSHETCPHIEKFKHTKKK